MATFGELTEDALELAESRASQPIDREGLRKKALMVGAPLAEPRSDRAARELISELRASRRPRRALEGLIADEIASGPSLSSDAARSAADWLDASLEGRGAALIDLLLLGDRLPSRRAPELGFPGLVPR